MKASKVFIWILLSVSVIFLASENLAFSDQTDGVDAYVTDWGDEEYLVKDIYSDFYPNSHVFYAWYGDSTVTIPFSNIKRIMITDRMLLSRSENKSARQYYCFGTIILKNHKPLECSWIPNGWKGGNNFGGEIFIRNNNWKKIQFGSSQIIKKKQTSSERSTYPYTIHVCSYQTREKSNRIAMQLRKKGMPAFACPTQVPGKGEYYRIFIGFYRTLAETRKAALKLRGQEDLYPLEAKMPYAIEVGAFNSGQELKKLEEKLRSEAYLAYSIPGIPENNKARLLIGAYRTEKETEKLSKELQNKGFMPKAVSR